MRTIVLSIQPKWATLIRSGEKTIELRRRFPRYLAGSAAYLYESSPNCRLTAVVQMGAIHELPVKELWLVHGEASCVDERHFATYFRDRDAGVGIEIIRHLPLVNDWDLGRLRQEFSFTAPQSWAYASARLVNAIGACL
ncbi:ASCH domain-containing protein [Mesorhizobium sp. VK25A]|uniref:ASCH domain-containing protein n=2 Tax=Mesorhizobium TaxID=68287 RepID=A0ABU5AEI8_9HYPH|nr:MULTISPECIES: ASCH domain-containing protein [unclassified Mesorhizobium]MDX8469377.1 ASCH domain-containing protein [Mesorhizobium sp. VK23B]MDX8475715.1 ASCH domain-containing protein [Mesorhizobium sp. VK23A]MDX8509005.1 ASCH domain-containing protein [Mesorhizobium sp. VK22E]MDX8535692.1 ASCH domain-containing protein [Mesorhizobium sp. VK25D]MDX8548418.1 ASCH domain-containing protein [Mesorhizobium sp. VK25A]